MGRPKAVAGASPDGRRGTQKDHSGGARGRPGRGARGADGIRASGGRGGYRLRWVPTGDARVTRYNVYTRQSGAQYGSPRNAGLPAVGTDGAMSYVVTGLSGSALRFAITAVTSTGQESAFSNEITSCTTAAECNDGNPCTVDSATASVATARRRTVPRAATATSATGSRAVGTASARRRSRSPATMATNARPTGAIRPRAAPTRRSRAARSVSRAIAYPLEARRVKLTNSTYGIHAHRQRRRRSDARHRLRATRLVVEVVDGARHRRWSARSSPGSAIAANAAGNAFRLAKTAPLDVARGRSEAPLRRRADGRVSLSVRGATSLCPSLSPPSLTLLFLVGTHCAVDSCIGIRARPTAGRRSRRRAGRAAIAAARRAADDEPGGKTTATRHAERARDRQRGRDGGKRAPVLHLVHVGAIDAGARGELEVAPAAEREQAGQRVPHRAPRRQSRSTGTPSAAATRSATASRGLAPGARSRTRTRAGRSVLKEQIEQARIDADKAEREGNLGRAAELRYGKFLDLQKQLETESRKLADIQEHQKILKEEVDDEDVAEIVSKWTGVPVTRMLEGEMQKLLHMEDRLRMRVVGQDEAILLVSDAVRRARAGIQDPNRPIGSFIFMGPTGVGKTELARALAEFLFDDEQAMIRIDMSEYQERHTVSRLIGAPPGYVGYDEGGQLTEAVRRRPYSVILFDEIEKAHPEVFNVLLQLLDDGRLTDGHGRTVDFKNTVVIMTSNIGSQYIQELQNDEEEMRRRVTDAMRQHFRPEFLNRVDDTVIFHPLDAEVLKKIVSIQVGLVQKRLADKKIEIELTDGAKELLAEEGFDIVYGARPLKRVIQRDVLNPLASKILSGDIKEGSRIIVDKSGRSLVFRAEAHTVGVE